MWRLTGSDDRVWYIHTPTTVTLGRIDVDIVISEQAIAASKCHCYLSSVRDGASSSDKLKLVDKSSRGTVILPRNLHVGGASTDAKISGAATIMTAPSTRTTQMVGTVHPAAPTAAGHRAPGAAGSPASDNAVELADGEMLVFGADYRVPQEIGPILAAKAAELGIDLTTASGEQLTSLARVAWTEARRLRGGKTGAGTYWVVVQYIPLGVAMSFLQPNQKTALAEQCRATGIPLYKEWPEARPVTRRVPQTHRAGTDTGASGSGHGSGPGTSDVTVTVPYTGVSHLVLGRLDPSQKFVRALLEGSHIVSTAWPAAMVDRLKAGQGGSSGSTSAATPSGRADLCAPVPDEAKYLPLLNDGVSLASYQPSLVMTNVHPEDGEGGTAAEGTALHGGASMRGTASIYVHKESRGAKVAPSGWMLDNQWHGARLEPMPGRLSTVFCTAPAGADGSSSSAAAGAGASSAGSGPRPCPFTIVYEVSSELTVLLRDTYGKRYGLNVISLRKDKNGVDKKWDEDDTIAQVQELLPLWTAAAAAGQCPGVLIAGDPGAVDLKTQLDPQLQQLRSRMTRPANWIVPEGSSGAGGAAGSSTAPRGRSPARRKGGAGAAGAAAAQPPGPLHGLNFSIFREAQLLHAIIAARPLPEVVQDWNGAHDRPGPVPYVPPHGQAPPAGEDTIKEAGKGTRGAKAAASSARDRVATVGPGHDGGTEAGAGHGQDAMPPPPLPTVLNTPAKGSARGAAAKSGAVEAGQVGGDGQAVTGAGAASAAPAAASAAKIATPVKSAAKGHGRGAGAAVAEAAQAADGAADGGHDGPVEDLDPPTPPVVEAPAGRGTPAGKGKDQTQTQSAGRAGGKRKRSVSNSSTEDEDGWPQAKAHGHGASSSTSTTRPGPAKRAALEPEADVLGMDAEASAKAAANSSTAAPKAKGRVNTKAANAVVVDEDGFEMTVTRAGQRLGQGQGQGRGAAADGITEGTGHGGRQDADHQQDESSGQPHHQQQPQHQSQHQQQSQPHASLDMEVGILEDPEYAARRAEVAEWKAGEERYAQGGVVVTDDGWTDMSRAGHRAGLGAVAAGQADGEDAAGAGAGSSAARVPGPVISYDCPEVPRLTSSGREDDPFDAVPPGYYGGLDQEDDGDEDDAESTKAGAGHDDRYQYRQLQPIPKGLERYYAPPRPSGQVQGASARVSGPGTSTGRGKPWPIGLGKPFVKVWGVRYDSSGRRVGGDAAVGSGTGDHDAEAAVDHDEGQDDGMAGPVVLGYAPQGVTIAEIDPDLAAQLRAEVQAQLEQEKEDGDILGGGALPRPGHSGRGKATTSRGVASKATAGKAAGGGMVQSLLVGALSRPSASAAAAARPARAPVDVDMGLGEEDGDPEGSGDGGGPSYRGHSQAAGMQGLVPQAVGLPMRTAGGAASGSASAGSTTVMRRSGPSSGTTGLMLPPPLPVRPAVPVVPAPPRPGGIAAALGAGPAVAGGVPGGLPIGQGSGVPGRSASTVRRR